MDVVDLIVGCLEAVFDVCVEEKEELALGHASLLAIKRAYSTVSESDSRYIFRLSGSLSRRWIRSFVLVCREEPVAFFA